MNRVAGPLTLLLLLLGSGCEQEKGQVAPAVIASPALSLGERYLLRIGNPDDLDDPASKWCYLDLLMSAGQEIDAVPWRPDGQELTVERAWFRQDTLFLELSRSYDDGDDDQRQASEHWSLRLKTQDGSIDHLRGAVRLDHEGEDLVGKTSSNFRAVATRTEDLDRSELQEAYEERRWQREVSAMQPQEPVVEELDH